MPSTTGTTTPQTQSTLFGNVQTRTVQRINADSIFAAARTVQFSGFRWKMRQANVQSEPGNNFFSDAPTEIYIDSTKKLHLSINNRNRYWYCSELVADTVLGYGTYAVFLEINLDTLPANVMIEFGLTPDKALHTYVPADIAIQCTRLGMLNSPNTLQYVVSRSDSARERKERIFRPDIPFRMKGYYSTHAFTWKESSVEFASYHDHGLPTPYLGALWEFSGSTALNLSVPKATTLYRMRLRVWSAGAPVGNRPFELVVKKIQFLPLKAYER
ncbi:MAG: hypothetical protein RML40_07235 [Bacteroidota bacterium]|nr:hypothetical protein [Candidatus Kapabacteria bacterium]MDW8220310.1 hypothetical protein [Bacteroidota bacterium]